MSGLCDVMGAWLLTIKVPGLRVESTYIHSSSNRVSFTPGTNVFKTLFSGEAGEHFPSLFLSRPPVKGVV
jgi:hypothetical protein